MFFRQFTTCALVVCVLAMAGPALAQDREPRQPDTSHPTAIPAAGPIAAAIERVQLDAEGLPHRDAAQAEPAASAAKSNGSSLLGKFILTGVGGVAGFIGGGRLGAVVDGPCGGCDDPGLKGALIGAPIGSVIGAVVGWKVAGLFD